MGSINKQDNQKNMQKYDFSIQLYLSTQNYSITGKNDIMKWELIQHVD